jgi:endonuclease/exonuclease/phosphatase family metal-dependent hydrolase
MTGITQDQVDAAQTIDVVLQENMLWLAEQTCSARSDEILFVTDGDADLGEFLKIAARMTPHLSVPHVYGRWCNIKVEFCKKYKRAIGHSERKKLQAMLSAAKIPWQGQLHSGLDDSVNIGHLLENLWDKGLRVFTSFTESQFRKKERRGQPGGESVGVGEERGGAGGEQRDVSALKFGSLNILQHFAFIKFAGTYGLDASEVEQSREWRFDNVVQTLRDIDCDVWGIQEIESHDHARELAERSGYLLHSEAYNSPVSKKSGVCILLRPQLVGRVVGQQPLQLDSKVAPVAGVTLGLGADAEDSFTITLLTTHLKMNYPRVSVGLTELGAAISALVVDISSTVVMGDLNVDTPQAQQDLIGRGRLSPCLASFSIGLEATPLLPDNVLIGCNVPRFAVGVCAYVPTLLLHAKGSPYKEEFNRSIMNHRAAVSDHYPILFKIETARIAQFSSSIPSATASSISP